MSLPIFPLGPDVVRWWATVKPDHVAIVDRTRDCRITYREQDAINERWAAALQEAGVADGDRVAAIATNSTALIGIFGGCLRLGAILVPLNWRLAAPELARVLGDAEPKVIIGEGKYRAVIEEAASLAGVSPRWIDLDAEAPKLLERAKGASVRHVVAEPDKPTMLLYTSGSTGRAKGVILPHRQMFFNAYATTTGWRLTPDDVAPVSTPFFHTGGWHVFTTPLLHIGGTVVVMDTFDPDAFLDALHEERCTVAFSVPTQIAMLAERPSWGRPLPALRWFISGGAPCPQALADRLRIAGIQYRQGFGLTECGPNCFATSDRAAIEKPECVGWPSPFLSMRLVREDGSDADVGEPGELLLRGPQMFAGYWKDPERTKEAVTPDGWLRTGDLAVRDEKGTYRICGRRKEMFISGGENVFPGEVEAVLADYPGVVEAVVVGVPDVKWGEVGHAFVIARNGAKPMPAELTAFARARLAGYKVPKRIDIVGDFPRLGSGKVDRAALAKRR